MPKAPEKLVDAFVLELVAYCGKVHTAVAAEHGPQAQLKVEWSDGPFTTRLFNLSWTATDARRRHHTSDEEDSLGIKLDFSPAREMWKSHPEMDGFFIARWYGDESDDDEEIADQIKLLRKWFRSAKRSPQFGMYDNVAYEFQVPIELMLDEAILQAQRHVTANGLLGPCKLAIEGHDGIFARTWKDARSDVARHAAGVRKAGGYRPTRAFLDEYMGLWTDNAAFASYWAARFEDLARSSDKPPPLIQGGP